MSELKLLNMFELGVQCKQGKDHFKSIRLYSLQHLLFIIIL